MAEKRRFTTQILKHPQNTVAVFVFYNNTNVVKNKLIVSSSIQKNLIRSVLHMEVWIHMSPKITVFENYVWSSNMKENYK